MKKMKQSKVSKRNTQREAIANMERDITEENASALKAIKYKQTAKKAPHLEDNNSDLLKLKKEIVSLKEEVSFLKEEMEKQNYSFNYDLSSLQNKVERLNAEQRKNDSSWGFNCD